jgi:dermatan 4-sulfotransferase 1
VQPREKIELRQSARLKLYRAFCNAQLKQDKNKLPNASLSHRNNNWLRSKSYRPPNSTYVIDPYKAIYCRIPKVGNTHWKQIMLHMIENVSMSDAVTLPIHKKQFDLLLPKLVSESQFNDSDVIRRLNEYFTFTFVRHPLDRLLSAFEDKVNPSALQKQYTVRYVPDMIRLCRQGAKNISVEQRKKNVTFEEFLCYVSKEHTDKLDRHWAPYDQICDFCAPQLNYDFIGDFEYMKEEAEFVLHRLGVKDVAYPAGYRTDKQRRDRFVQAYSAISKKTLKAIHERFRRDFEMFGYKAYPDFWYSTAG